MFQKFILINPANYNSDRSKNALSRRYPEH
jgi:hypothetical protein